MTELQSVLAYPKVQAKIEEGKRRVQDHRNAVGKCSTPSLLTDWTKQHQAIIEGYLTDIIAIADTALASYLAEMPQDQAWKTFWQTEEKQKKLTRAGDQAKRKFERLIKERYLEDSTHGGPLHFLFDMVSTQAVIAVFKLKFGDS